jgi:hypothetical protein
VSVFDAAGGARQRERHGDPHRGGARWGTRGRPAAGPWPGRCPTRRQ